MRISPRLVGVSLIAAVIVAVILSVLPNFPPRNPFAAPSVPRPARTIPFTDVNPYGANFFLEGEAEEWKVEKSLEMAQAAGIGFVKQQFPWEDLQLSPGPNGYWDNRLNKSTWQKYDDIVNLAAKYNLQVIARLDRPPAWTRIDNRNPERPPDDYERYGDFVYDVVKHFKGRIHYYQIWDEPNIYPEWGDQPPDPAAYTRLLRIAYQRAKEADPNVVILSAPLAQTLENSARNMSDINFLRGMYAAGAGPYFNILFANSYGFAFPPTDPPSPERLNFQRVVLLHEIMVENGDVNKPVWFNEFGWNAAPSTFAPDKLPWARVSEQVQAQYTVEAVQYARAHWPWAGVFNIWYFRQPGSIPLDRADYYFRMVDPGFTPRPVYNAVKDVATRQGVAVPGTYAVTDPAVSFSGHWQPVLSKKIAGGVSETSSQLGDNLTITFDGGGLTLDVIRAPNAGQVFITVDGRVANRLSDQFQGRSVLTLSATDEEAPTPVPIVDGLPEGRHVLRLVVGPSPGPTHGEVDFAGFSVTPADPSAGRFRTLVIALSSVGMGIIVLLFGGFRTSGR